MLPRPDIYTRTKSFAAYVGTPQRKKRKGCTERLPLHTVAPLPPGAKGRAALPWCRPPHAPRTPRAALIAPRVPPRPHRGLRAEFRSNVFQRRSPAPRAKLWADRAPSLRVGVAGLHLAVMTAAVMTAVMTAAMLCAAGHVAAGRCAVGVLCEHRARAE